jgi:hypothetical protein
MEDEKETRPRFLGTYFDPTTIFRLASISRIMGWIILVVYAADFGLAIMVMVLQIIRGFWSYMGATDYASNILITLERPFRGLVYFILLLGISEVLKVLVEIEENTRRAARNLSK